MKKVIAGMFIVGAIALVIILVVANRETPEQVDARWNLDAIDRIEAAWQAHRERPPIPGVGPLDARQFDQLIRDMQNLDLYGAADEVTAVRDKYIQLGRDAPKFLDKLKEGFPDQHHVAGTRLSRKNDDWLTDVRNAGIQVEVALREIKAEVERLRNHYTAILGK